MKLAMEKHGETIGEAVVWSRWDEEYKAARRVSFLRSREPQKV